MILNKYKKRLLLFSISCLKCYLTKNILICVWLLVCCMESSLNYCLLDNDLPYIQTDRQTYIHTYIHTYIQTDRQTYIHTYIQTYIHTHTYIQTYIHTHTYIQYENPPTESRNSCLHHQCLFIYLFILIYLYRITNSARLFFN